MIGSSQIRAARALLNWSQAQLSEASGVAEVSIKNIERGDSDARSSTLDAIARAFDMAGVEMTNGGQPGARFRKITTGDLVRVKRANLLFAEFGDHIGRVLRERPEVKMGSVERVDATFPGKRDLIGVETAVLEFAALRWDFRRAPSGPIWRADGQQAGYVKDGAIYDINNEKIYLLRDLDIFDLKGNPTGKSLGNLQSARRGDASVDELFPPRS